MASSPDLSKCVVGPSGCAPVQQPPPVCLSAVNSIASNLSKAVAAREFVPPPPPPTDDAIITSLGNAAWYQSEEWRGHAMYWRDRSTELSQTVEQYKQEVMQLSQTAEHYKQKSAGLGKQLGFCTQVLQTHSDDRKKEVAKLEDQLGVVRAENVRLASLLSTSITKTREYDQLKFERDRLMEERDQLRDLVDNMSSTLSGFLSHDYNGDRVIQFSGSVFASHPVDGSGA